MFCFTRLVSSDYSTSFSKEQISLGTRPICRMKAMAPHSSTLAWKILWTEEPGRLQSMGSLRVENDWATSLSLFTFMDGKGNGNPLHCSCLERPRDGGAWWAAIYGVTQSRTRLKRLSSSKRPYIQRPDIQRWGRVVKNVCSEAGLPNECSCT